MNADITMTQGSLAYPTLACRGELAEKSREGVVSLLLIQQPMNVILYYIIRLHDLSFQCNGCVNPKIYHGMTWYTVAYRGITWYIMVLHGKLWLTMLFIVYGNYMANRALAILKHHGIYG